MVAAGYKPPAPELIYAAGRDMLAAIRIGAWMFKEGKYITQYDHHIAGKLAYVMCGGELTRPQWVSEQYILDLEREAIPLAVWRGKNPGAHVVHFADGQASN